MSDIRLIKLGDAQQIYRVRFWDLVRGDDLPPALALRVFDSAVNNGPGQAIRWLQRAARVKEDGQLGPITLAATSQTPGIAAPFHAFRVYETTKLSNWLHNSRGWAIRFYALPFQAQELAASMD